MPSYSADFKSVIISKLIGPKPPSIRQVSKDTGIAPSTLHDWVGKARSTNSVDIPKRVKRVQNWTKQEKFEALLATSNMSEEQLNAFCRKNGLFSSQIEQWKLEFMNGLSNKGGQEKQSKIKALESELKDVKQDLKRKDKALAEASAIIFLKKKAQELWGEPEEEK